MTLKRMMIIGLLALFVALQAQLWFAQGGIAEAHTLQQQLTKAQAENDALANRNATFTAEISDLKHGQQAIAERARDELGLAKKGEKVYRIV